MRKVTVLLPTIVPRRNHFWNCQHQFTNSRRKGGISHNLIMCAQLLPERKPAYSEAFFCKGFLALLQKLNPPTKDRDWPITGDVVVIISILPKRKWRLRVPGNCLRSFTLSSVKPRLHLMIPNPVLFLHFQKGLHCQGRGIEAKEEQERMYPGHGLIPISE